MATVSHELHTPLTSIAGALGLLVNDAGGTLPARAMRLLTIARANSQRLVWLVNSILDMEKIESGKSSSF
ncbi:MAG TPA: histidine kinase dimerization/phospho-acceptor domain-containing protein [Xanthobacteraceae bacterium]|nr:histidine kinase dimerization/phospho-acceptor domain-containing protein [Xanthobacteraceae bacterium]